VLSQSNLPTKFSADFLIFSKMFYTHATRAFPFKASSLITSEVEESLRIFRGDILILLSFDFATHSHIFCVNLDRADLSNPG